MKSVLSLLPLLASAAVLPIEKRQHSHGDMEMGAKDAPKSELAAFAASYAKIFSGGLPAKKAYKIEEMTPKFQDDAKRIKVIYGPFKVKGTEDKGQVGNMFSMDRYGTSYQYMIDNDFPKDITILNTKSGVFDEEFQRSDIAKGLYNHHNIFMNLNQGAPAVVDCGGKPVSMGYGDFGGAGKTPGAGAGGLGGGLGGPLPVSIFAGGATEEAESYYAAKDSPIKSGYYIGPKDRLTFGMDVVNYRNTSREVYIITEMEYVPGKIAGAGAANGAVISLGMCNGVDPLNIQTKDSAAKFTLDSGSDITFARDGYFAGWKAHLHDGGVKMVSYLNGKEVCTSEALYGGPGHTGKSASGETWTTIREMTGCGTLKIKKGDKLQVKAYYDTDLHPSREEAHGEMAEQMGLLTGMWIEPPKA